MASDESALAQRWKLVHGENNWEGMLDPLDFELRRELIRYGEFIEAVYDSLDEETDSKYQYYPLYGKSSLFSNVGLGDTKKYTIKRYIYCTEKTGFLKLFFGPTDAVWMGFIAVSDDDETARLGRRDIVVVFRGTQRDIEWIYNVREALVPFPNLDRSTVGVPLVHKGFLALYDSADTTGSTAFGGKSLRQQVVDELHRLIQTYKDEEVSITVLGHSLGGALATLCAYDICNSKVNEGGIQVAAFTYASPKVGSVEFKRQSEALVKILRLVDRRDVVPMVPPPAALYKHQGVEFKVDGSQSPFFKFAPFWSIWKPHNLEAYLHVVAGFKKYFLPPSFTSKLVSAAPVPVKTVTKAVGGLFTGVVGGVTGVVTTTVGTVATTVEKILPIDQVVMGLIGNDAEGMRVYNALKELFADDPESLQEFLLNVVDITRANMGTGDNFKLVMNRDIALVNKRDDILKDECEIPKAWWVIRNRNMVQGDDMTWLPRHKRPKDTPSPDNPEFL